MGKLMRRESSTPIQTIVSERSQIPVVVWASLSDCEEECPLYETCEAKKDSEKKCSLMREYFSHIINSAIAVHGSYFNEKIGVSIGMNIMPLYAQLFKFKILEKSLKMNELIRVNKKGDMMIHPLYKEMRECVKLLDGLWGRIGMRNFSKSETFSSEDFVSGDADYYSAISADEVE